MDSAPKFTIGSKAINQAVQRLLLHGCTRSSQGIAPWRWHMPNGRLRGTTYSMLRTSNAASACQHKHLLLQPPSFRQQPPRGPMAACCPAGAGSRRRRTRVGEPTTRQSGSARCLSCRAERGRLRRTAGRPGPAGRDDRAGALTGGDRGGHPSGGWSRWGWGSHPRCGRS